LISNVHSGPTGSSPTSAGTIGGTNSEIDDFTRGIVWSKRIGGAIMVDQGKGTALSIPRH